ncbi:MAG: hypothetical protein H7330_13495 [Hymenobacteraceae bacterium]|nr:hypothetical protein [Hymenobacteraceae bacterium]
MAPLFSDSSSPAPTMADRRAVLRERLQPPASCPLPPGYLQAILAGQPTPPHPAARSTGWVRATWQRLTRWLRPAERAVSPATAKPSTRESFRML